MKDGSPSRVAPEVSSVNQLLWAGLGDPSGTPPMPEAPDTVPLGKWGDYKIIQKISRGGMGRIYLAWQPSLERFVALKFLLPELNAIPQFVERFRREAKAAASLRHPNIVSVHEVGEVEGQVFFSMDFIEGRNLAAVVKEGPLPWRQAARYCQIIAQTIEYAHNRWVLHRDLKPSNILIDLHDQPQVTDFGLAGKMEVRSHLTLTNHILGSPSYLSPEQAAGRVDDITSACDVYAIGVILYECLTGHPPFRADSIQETLLCIREKYPVSPRSLGVMMPRDLETICLKCLEKNPVRRYESARALAEDLERCQNGEAILARPRTRLEMRLGMAGRWMRKHPRMAAVYGVSLGLLLIFVVQLSVANRQLFLENRRLVESLKDQERSLSEVHRALAEKGLVDVDDGHEESERLFQHAAALPGNDPEKGPVAGPKNHALSLP